MAEPSAAVRDAAALRRSQAREHGRPIWGLAGALRLARFFGRRDAEYYPRRLGLAAYLPDAALPLPRPR